MVKILVGQEARSALYVILASFKDDRYPAMPGVFGMFKKGRKYIAFDNCTNDCWVEEFTSAPEAIKWLNS